LRRAVSLARSCLSDRWSHVEMSQNESAKAIVVFVSVLVSCLCGCSRSEGTPQTRNLPAVDKAELFRLAKNGDVWNGEFAAQAILAGDDAKAAAQLWRAQSFSDDSPICHNPGFAIKFYNHDVLVVYATLCWECNNIEFLSPRLDKYVGFDAEGKKGQELLSFLEQKLPQQNAVAFSIGAMRTPRLGE
jgi:hypothetical protein